MTNGEKILNALPKTVTIRLWKNENFTYIEIEHNNNWIADFSIEWWNSKVESEEMYGKK